MPHITDRKVIWFRREKNEELSCNLHQYTVNFMQWRLIKRLWMSSGMGSEVSLLYL